MERPSIDRINSNEHYTFENCRYIENRINCSKDKIKNVLQYDLNNKFIKEWTSIREISKALGIDYSCINRCCLGQTKTSKGFIWKYKT